jgi:arginine/ornithine transport system permease protein
MSLEVIVNSLPLYLQGLLNTVWLTAAALLIGLVLSVPLSIARASKNPFLSKPVWAYSYVFRGTPLFVQLLLIYYGSGQFEAVRDSFAWPLLQQAWFCALLAFTLNTAAYTTEILRGAIESTPHGEIEAAKACGMSPGLMFRRIVMPSAFRRALPAYGNECVFMLHGSAVASTVTLIDLTGAANIVSSRYYSPYEAYGMAAVFYMGLTFGIVGAFLLLERHMLRHLKPRST